MVPHCGISPLNYDLPEFQPKRVHFEPLLRRDRSTSYRAFAGRSLPWYAMIRVFTPAVSLKQMLRACNMAPHSCVSAFGDVHVRPVLDESVLAQRYHRHTCVSKSGVSRFLLSCLFSIWMARNLMAMFIVVIWTPTQVFIGADSKRTAGVGPATVSVCKIGKARGFFFAAGGLEADPKTGYSTHALLHRAASRYPSDMQRSANLFKQLAVTHLPTAVARISKHEPEIFSRRFRPGDTAVGAVFIGLGNQTPRLIAMDFIPKSAGAGHFTVTVRTSECPGSGCTPSALFLLGRHDAIKKYVRANPEFWRIGGELGVLQLINVQIAASPEDVGPPVDILRLDTKGPTWVQKKPECPDLN